MVTDLACIVTKWAPYKRTGTQPFNAFLKKYKSYQNNPAKVQRLAKEMYFHSKIAEGPGLKRQRNVERRNSVLKSNSKSQNIKLLLPLQENLVHEEKALGGSFNNHFTSTSQNIDLLPGPAGNLDCTMFIRY